MSVDKKVEEVIAFITEEMPWNEEKSIADGWEEYRKGLHEHRVKFGTLKFVQGDAYENALRERHEYALQKVREFYERG